MEELIELVSGKAGITPDQAKVVAEIVVGYFLSKLSQPCGDEIASRFNKFATWSEPDTKYSLLSIVEEKAGITLDQAEAAARATDEYIRGVVSEPCGNEIARRIEPNPRGWET